jgi:hypothetical protein
MDARDKPGHDEFRHKCANSIGGIPDRTQGAPERISSTTTSFGGRANQPSEK